MDFKTYLIFLIFCFTTVITVTYLEKRNAFAEIELIKRVEKIEGKLELKNE